MQRTTAPPKTSTARDRGRWAVIDDLRPGTEDAVRVPLTEVSLKAMKRLRDRQKAMGQPITLRKDGPEHYLIHRVHPSTSS